MTTGAKVQSNRKAAFGWGLGLGQVGRLKGCFARFYSEGILMNTV